MKRKYLLFLEFGQLSLSITFPCEKKMRQILQSTIRTMKQNCLLSIQAATSATASRGRVLFRKYPCKPATYTSMNRPNQKRTKPHVSQCRSQTTTLSKPTRAESGGACVRVCVVRHKTETSQIDRRSQQRAERSNKTGIGTKFDNAQDSGSGSERMEEEWIRTLISSSGICAANCLASSASSSSSKREIIGTAGFLSFGLSGDDEALTVPEPTAPLGDTSTTAVPSFPGSGFVR